ncbi:sensor histidine kinase [Blastococcus sp. TF02A-26]|uniref:sensor histidine kinase n=1 Tax=Blastococcus sp. TF02A-26 TaxID=2250577 RepID=UPI0011BFB633|nr:histidine kinase [Blastococcus sp. TF02A-26]
MPTVSRWWESRTDPQRIDLYTRWSFYGWLGTTPLLAVGIHGSAQRPGSAAATAFLVGAVAVATTCVVLARAGFLARSEGRPLPSVPLVVTAVAAAGTSALAAVAYGSDEQDSSALVWGLALPPAMALVATSTVWSSPLLVRCGVAVGVLVGCAAALLGSAPAAAAVLAAVIGATVVLLALAFRFTVWVLDVVVEMDRTRGVQLQLAVAEERLRFARDLHDVMGRDLSAIAVKSQLAGELVRRQRPEAADEVADISRIAEQSLREVREVVRGYRTADLGSELAGARSVLRAAGVDCTVAGEDGGADLPDRVQTALAWVVREAVTNVLRHSRARTCSIALVVDGGTARLTVTNDGVTSDDPRWGSGLTGLAERLGTASGTLTTAAEGGHFLLTAALPVGDAA